MKKNIVFLCTGDTCRGPMCVGYFRKLCEEAQLDNLEIRSAGVLTVHGLLATPETLQMLKAEGVDLSRHRSCQFTPDLLRKADLILGMTSLHTQSALRAEASIADKTFLLKEYTRSDLKKVQIDDPMGNTLEVYKRVFAEIRKACKLLMKMPIITGEEPPAPPESKPTRKRASVSSKADAAKPKIEAKPSGKSKTAAAKPAAKAAPAAKTTPAAEKPAAAKPVAKAAAAKPAPKSAKTNEKTPAGSAAKRSEPKKAKPTNAE